jgi:hypothetical protein
VPTPKRIKPKIYELDDFLELRHRAWVISRRTLSQFRDRMKHGSKGQSLLCAFALSSAALFAAGQSTTTRIDAELKPLQGYWEGEGAGGKCSITITGTSLLYRAGTNWFKTTFTLPADTAPAQLHATITASSPPTNNVIGTVVFAIFKIEDGILTLAVEGDRPPESFDSAASRYIVRKVQPPKDDTAPPKSR